jgi:hypothetical protein
LSLVTRMPPCIGRSATGLWRLSSINVRVYKAHQPPRSTHPLHRKVFSLGQGHRGAHLTCLYRMGKTGFPLRSNPAYELGLKLHRKRHNSGEVWVTRRCTSRQRSASFAAPGTGRPTSSARLILALTIQTVTTTSSNTTGYFKNFTVAMSEYLFASEEPTT